MQTENILTDFLGHRYRLIGSADLTNSPRPPLSFFDIQSCLNYLHSLNAPFGFWRQYPATSNMAPAPLSQNDPLPVAQSIIEGRLHLVQIGIIDPFLFPPAQRTAVATEAYYRFEPKIGLKDVANAKLKAFNHLEKVTSFLKNLQLTEAQYNQILNVYHRHSSASATQQNAPLSHSQIKEKLVKLVFQQEIVVIVLPRQQQNILPQTQGLADALPPVKPVQLAPESKSTWIEIRLENADGTAIANQALTLIDGAGVEHSLTSSSNGAIRVTDLPTGDCKVLMTDQP